MWKETWKINIVSTGKLLELYEKEYEIEGKLKIFENVRRPPGVRLIIEKENKILLTKEYRSETKWFDVRLPWGKVFDRISDMKAYEGEMSDAARDAAVIEAREECGIEIKKDNLELFRVSHCGATIEWDLYYFLVRDFVQTGKQDLGDGEYITYEWYDREQILQCVRDWLISEDRTNGILWQYFLKNYD